MPKQSLSTLQNEELSGKRVLMRVDFNVPLDSEGKITDDTRIRAALPSINHLIKNDAKVILSAHFGRPKGVVNESMRLTPVAQRLSELLKKDVLKTDSCIGEDTKRMVGNLSNGNVLLLENVRFFAEEEANDKEFSRSLSQLLLISERTYGASSRPFSTCLFTDSRNNRSISSSNGNQSN